ncbi:MAG: hypothetical protein LBT48_00615 [Prevotellaceae bacterium]|nr:hypothetical protein [Prevotellaceae bacterium]
MKTNLLLPNKFRLIGWVLLIPATLLGYVVLFNQFFFPFLTFNVLSLLPDSFGSASDASPLWTITTDNFTNEFAGILFIVSAIFVAFSKEKNEDEYISKIRLESLMWATYVTYAIQILCLLFFYEFSFLTAALINLFTILIVFIIRYNFMIYRSKVSKQ